METQIHFFGEHLSFMLLPHGLTGNFIPNRVQSEATGEQNGELGGTKQNIPGREQISWRKLQWIHYLQQEESSTEFC